VYPQDQQVINAQGVDVNYEEFINEQTLYVSQAAWFSRSIDCQNLTGKAVVFGDSTHAAAMTKGSGREEFTLFGRVLTASMMLVPRTGE